MHFQIFDYIVLWHNLNWILDNNFDNFRLSQTLHCFIITKVTELTAITNLKVKFRDYSIDKLNVVVVITIAITIVFNYQMMITIIITRCFN